MTDLLERNQAAVADLCRQYGVRRLEVFGSATGDSFDPARSDVDLLVEYEPGTDLGPWLARYFELQEALEALFGRSVDLLMSGAPGLANPYFAREVERTRRLVYAG